MICSPTLQGVLILSRASGKLNIIIRDGVVRHRTLRHSRVRHTIQRPRKHDVHSNCSARITQTPVGQAMAMRESPDPSTPFLDTVEGEIAFFRSIMRARPIGLHRHFHVLSIRTVIHQDTGRYVTIDDIWEKLQKCYNIEALESLVRPQRTSPHPDPSSLLPETSL